MLSKITLVSLLLVSTSILAHTADDPQHAHQAYWRDSSGAPILDRNGDCVRTGSFITLGSPSCYPPEETVTESTATEPPTKTSTDASTDTTAEVSSSTLATVEAEDTQPQETEQRAPESPKQEVVTETAKVTPTPVAKPVQPTLAEEVETEAEPEVVTYSYPVESIGTHIYFDFDKNNLKIAEQEKLEEVVIAAMQAHKVVKVSVEGHADSRGTDEYNYDLSQRRINTVVNYLNLRGIETNSTMAWGESKLIYFADGSENYDHSRRAEVTVRIMKKVKN